jgi:hypothetical protein
MWIDFEKNSEAAVFCAPTWAKQTAVAKTMLLLGQTARLAGGCVPMIGGLLVVCGLLTENIAKTSMLFVKDMKDVFREMEGLKVDVEQLRSTVEAINSQRGLDTDSSALALAEQAGLGPVLKHVTTWVNDTNDEMDRISSFQAKAENQGVGGASAMASRANQVLNRLHVMRREALSHKVSITSCLQVGSWAGEIQTRTTTVVNAKEQ